MRIFFLQAVVVSVVTVAADAADRSCEEQRQSIDQVLYTSRRTSSLLTPVFSSAGNSCFASLLHL
jgi:hypothetical protein